MKRVLQALTLTAAATLAAFTPAPSTAALPPTSTCWLTCIGIGTGIKNYKAFHVTQSACCSGAVLTCPAGSSGSYAWGEPAQLCSFGGEA